MPNRWKKFGLGLQAMPALLGVMLFAGTSAHAQYAQQMPQGQDDASMAAQEASADPSQDPPSQVARISVIQGNVSYEPASVDQFSPAELNYPLTTGDRIWTDVNADGEVQTGNVAVRMGAQTDLTATAITDTLQQFGLGQGAVHLKTFALDPNSTVEVDTPNVAVTVLQPGDVRVSVDPNGDVTTVTVRSGQVEVDGNGLQQPLQAGQSAVFAGMNPVSVQWTRPMAMDALDQFSASRDNVYAQGFSSDGNNLNAETIGGEDLGQYGSWESDPDYGSVWYPGGVSVAWAPYTVGHWAWIAPWGWTWVEGEPWGFAPFHYGRWNRFGNRWGWIPGPPMVHPVWSPALVVFTGAPGVTAWFPLGPREPFVPWYHVSTLYVNRVNVTNIYTRNMADIRTIYNQRTSNVYMNAGIANRTWVNRGATVAVSQQAFAAGRPVGAARVDARQVAGTPIIPHPMVSPQRSMVAPGQARAVPPVTSRPVMASHEEPVARPVGNSNIRMAPGSVPITRTPTPNPQPMQPQPQPRSPVVPPQPYRADQPAQPSEPAHPVQPSQPVQNQAVPNQSDQRTLYNRSVPPQPRPSFDQQRQAMEQNDPGRPLSPQQMNNVRQNQPAGPQQQREAVPHPAPAPQSHPAPAPPPQDKRR